MGVRFACHSCGQKLNIKSDLAGRRGICPACAVRFRIPLRDSEKSTPLDDESSSHGVGNDSGPERQPSDHPPPGDHLPNQGAPNAVERAAVKGAASNSQAVVAPPASKPPTTILDDESEGTWYVRPPSGGQYGPATSDLLKQWIDEGRVAATALLWRDGWPQWRDASEALPELVAKLPENPLLKSKSEPVAAAVGSESTARVPTKADHAATADSGAVASGTVDSGSLDSVPIGAPQLSGESTVGTNRRRRSNRRIYLIGVLTALAASLIAALIFVANR